MGAGDPYALPGGGSIFHTRQINYENCYHLSPTSVGGCKIFPQVLLLVLTLLLLSPSATALLSQHYYHNTSATTPLSQHHCNNTTVATPLLKHRCHNTIIATLLSQRHYRNTTTATPLPQHYYRNTTATAPQLQHPCHNTTSSGVSLSSHGSSPDPNVWSRRCLPVFPWLSPVLNHNEATLSRKDFRYRLGL